jgi:hypothetical protein
MNIHEIFNGLINIYYVWHLKNTCFIFLMEVAEKKQEIMRRLNCWLSEYFTSSLKKTDYSTSIRTNKTTCIVYMVKE